MKIIDIKTGFQCNNRCKFCIQEGKRFFKKTKTTKEIKEVLSSNADDFEGIVFTGGEVTIRDDVFEIVKFAKQCGYKVIQIQSNGRMFSYMDFCQKMIEAGATNFGLSIHGSTKEMHEGLTRAKGSFNQTIQGIQNLRKLNNTVSTNSVITKINYKDLPNIAKMAVELKVASYQFAFMHINSKILESREMIEEIVSRYKDIKPYVEEGLQIGIDNNVKSKVEAFPFCILDKKYHGNISENYLPEAFIFEDDSMRDFTKMKKNGAKLKGENCKLCQFYEKCEGPWCDYPKIFGFDEFIPIK
ncbi:MAG: radical SAM protein [Clostridia bacterium]|nr:radical SAM protein [Clostridia bacterium]